MVRAGDDTIIEDDALLVAALRAGDEAAFVTLIDRYQASLVRLAMLYVPNRAAAEDVVQETWLGVLQGIGRFEARSSLKTWLFRILVNRAKRRGARAPQHALFRRLEPGRRRRRGGGRGGALPSSRTSLGRTLDVTPDVVGRPAGGATRLR